MIFNLKIGLSKTSDDSEVCLSFGFNPGKMEFRSIKKRISAIFKTYSLSQPTQNKFKQLASNGIIETTQHVIILLVLLLYFIGNFDFQKLT